MKMMLPMLQDNTQMFIMKRIMIQMIPQKKSYKANIYIQTVITKSLQLLTGENWKPSIRGKHPELVI